MSLRHFVVAVGIVLAAAGTSRAQTPFAMGSVSGAAPPSARAEAVATGVALTAASAANPWLGGQLGYKFGNSDELAQNLLVSAGVLYEIPMSATRLFRLPVISNFANLLAQEGKADSETEAGDDKLKELMLGATGIRAGIYPYREIVGLKQEDFNVVVHGEASWKINGFKADDSDEVNYVNQLRLSAGFEVAIGKSDDDHRPLTLSITPVITKFDPAEYEKVFKERKADQKTLEIVAVLPIAAKSGVLFEFIRGDVNAFRAGVVVVGAK